MIWLLENTVMQEIQRALDANFVPSTEQQKQFEAMSVTAQDGTGSRVLSMGNGRASIIVRGILTDSPDLMSMIFGGGNTTYEELMAAYAQAEGSSDVEEIELYVDSPGGQASAAWEQVMEMISKGEKKSTAIITGRALSAAYGIVSQADNIKAINRMVSAGSVGVAGMFRVREDMVEVTSTFAPDKRPDVTTEEGKAVVRRQLDAIHQLFAENVARGRGTTVDVVNQEYGRGATLLAREALDRGMIDTIAETVLSAVGEPENQRTAAGGQTEKAESVTMDLEELKAKHPGLYMSVMQAGQEAGAKGERDRILAHMQMGEMAGDMEMAKKAINDGTEMTASLNAQYMSAAFNKRDQDGRAGDDAAAAAAADGVKNQGRKANEPTLSEEDKLDEEAAAMVAEQFGVVDDQEGAK